jgi:hypothetical protein
MWNNPTQKWRGRAQSLDEKGPDTRTPTLKTSIEIRWNHRDAVIDRNELSKHAVQQLASSN